MVMIHKKEVFWKMFLDHREINKITIKYAVHIPVVDELLNELQKNCFLTKLDLHSVYHKIRMRKKDIPKIFFRTDEVHYEFLVSLWPY
jgi:hypothetical protein